MATIAEASRRRFAGRIHFIFHTAFCCSTLLARALDAPGYSMGLKEPAVLFDLAHAWLQRRSGARPETALTVSLNLLSRPQEGEEVQIAKPSNGANHLAPLFLECAPGSRAIVMHSDLVSYLHGLVRRGEDGRAFGRRLLLDWAMAGAHALTPAYLVSITDLQASALAWFLQARQLSALRANHPERVATLSSRAFLERKRETLERVSTFFGLGAGPDVWRAKAEGPVFREHAKNLGQPFDESGTPAPDKAALREVHSAAEWAATVARQEGWLPELGDTLAA